MHLVWATLFGAVFSASSPVLAEVSDNCFLYLLNRFLAIDKNPHPLTYFLVLGFTEKRAFPSISKQCQINFVFDF